MTIESSQVSTYKSSAALEIRFFVQIHVSFQQEFFLARRDAATEWLFFRSRGSVHAHLPVFIQGSPMEAQHCAYKDEEGRELDEHGPRLD